MKTLSRATHVLLSSLLLITGGNALAQNDIDLENEDNRIAYSIGVNIGSSLVAQQILDGIDLDSFIGGMLDAVNGDTKLTEEEMFAAIQIFQTRVEEETASALTGNLTASEEYLRSNGARNGVVTTESGLQYEIIDSGPAGGASPTASDAVLAHYHGTLSDGTVFDSSVERGEPAQFGLSQVISGWTEALQLMKVGDKWRLYLHPDLAYGEASPTPAIPPNSALIFEVELLEIR